MSRSMGSILSRQRPTRLAESLNEHFDTARYVFAVAAPLGVVVGFAIAGYDYVVNDLLWSSLSHHLTPSVLCLMPIVALTLTGIILSLFRVKSSSMADEVVRAYHRPDQTIDYKAAVPKLTASIATMGFGGSAGMEGASKWLGATITSWVQNKLNRHKSLRLFHGKAETTLMVGAAAGIAAIFRAPLTGAIMGIESPYKHDLAHEALIPGLVASATSYATFSFLRPSTPYFPIGFTYHIHIRDLLLCLPVGILGGLASHLFLALLGKTKRRFQRWTAPRVFKSFCGGVLIAAVAWITLQLVHSPATLQAGLPVANQLLHGDFVFKICLLLFALKLIATVLTFGMGGVGGLFVPSAMIGAALGAACDAAFHPSQPGLFTLIGIAAFTGASYNSLLFSAVFVAEATGSPALVVPALIASSMAFLVAAGISNSESQRESRSTDDAKLSTMPCSAWMSTRIVVSSPGESLAMFHDRAVLEHTFDELPVVARDGTYLGLAAMKSLRLVPQDKWTTKPVTEITDRGARTVCPYHSMEVVEHELIHGVHDYIPVVDPATDHLLGVLSGKDVLRARNRAREMSAKAVSNIEFSDFYGLASTKEIMQEHFSSISALRIYLRRGDVKKSTTWWARLAEKPLSTYLVQAAMKAGIVHAAVNLSHVGYTRDVTKVSYDHPEIPTTTLPVCVELLAPKRVLDQFIRDEARHLKNTTLVMVDGVHISDLYLAEVEQNIETKPHSVEYIRGSDGQTEIQLEHVDVDEAVGTPEPQPAATLVGKEMEQAEDVAV